MRRTLSITLIAFLALSTYIPLPLNAGTHDTKAKILVDATHGAQWDSPVILEAAESLEGVLLDVIYAPRVLSLLKSINGSVNPQGMEGDRWTYEFRLLRRVSTLAVVFERRPGGPSFLNFWFKVSAPDGRAVDQWNYKDVEGVVMNEPALGVYRITAVNYGKGRIEFAVRIGEGSDPLAPENLKNYDALILLDPGLGGKTVFSKREIESVLDFVRDGKGLLLSWSRYGTKTSLNSISNFYGIRFLEEGFKCDEVDAAHYKWPIVRNFAQHPLTKGVYKLVCIGTRLEIDRSKAVPIVYDDEGRPLVAVSKRYKVIAVGVGEGAFDFLDVPDHLRFVENVIKWMLSNAGRG